MSNIYETEYMLILLILAILLKFHKRVLGAPV